ncbi:hypothetical protein C8Q70DRAFT_916328 [Cubamyces menziesii]|nr:hypothetical protein C8Q70DRAFT_916328 [Cubamyces menziesii]
MAVVPKSEPQEAVLPPLPPPPPQPKPQSKPTIDPKERDAAKKELGNYRRVTAWPIHRWPLEKRPVQARTRVHLPRTYRARHGSDVRTVWPGTDLNQFVHRHYAETVGGEREGEGRDDVKGGKGKEGREGKDKEGRESEKEKRLREEWPNYVAGEAVLAKRHEYLGPDPRVAGYWVDADGEYHIKWYDAFLKDHWVDNREWEFDVRLNARGEWVDVDDVD